MDLSAAALLLGAAVLGCLPLTVVARRILRGGNRSRHHEIGSAVFLQLGAIYAVLLAFIFNEVYAEYVVAAQAINRECSGLHGAAMLAVALPDPAGRDGVRHAMERYLGDVIHREWRTMADGHPDEETEAAQVALMRAAVDVPAPDPSAQATRGAMISQLLEAHANRETRLFEMSLTVPGLVWLLLFCITGVLVSLLVLADIESFWPQAALTAAFVGAIVFFLLVIRLLDNPFQGPLGLPATDFRKTLERVEHPPTFP
ncbi:MAG: DUF4239 domain-containing protein [Gluconacetobacter diazotrophicus]|nr:DUF4239 domain-containing protein [Gluconacetobacter diazotrophicus]